MKTATIIFSCFLFLTCTSNQDRYHSRIVLKPTIDDTLRKLFLNNVNQIDSICDSIIRRYNANDKNKKGSSMWMSATLDFTEFAPNILGEIAAKAGDSTECIVVEMKVYNNRNEYNDRNQKNSIMISALDSTCSKKLRRFNRKLDSTERFIFGVNRILLK